MLARHIFVCCLLAFTFVQGIQGDEIYFIHQAPDLYFAFNSLQIYVLIFLCRRKINIFAEFFADTRFIFLSIILCRRRSGWPPGKLLRRWSRKSLYVAFKVFKNHSMLLFDDFVIIFKDPDIVDINWLNQNQFQGLAWPCKLSYWYFKPWERLNLLLKTVSIAISNTIWPLSNLAPFYHKLILLPHQTHDLHHYHQQHQYQHHYV